MSKPNDMGIGQDVRILMWQCFGYSASANYGSIRAYVAPRERIDNKESRKGRSKTQFAASEASQLDRDSKDMPWSKAITYDTATRLLADYDAQVAEAAPKSDELSYADNSDIDVESTFMRLLPPFGGATSKPKSPHTSTDYTGKSQRENYTFGKSMPSTVMHRLGIEFYEDVKKRRHQHGLRIRVLSVLTVLRHLIRTCGNTRDTSGRVYMYLADLNQLYIDYLCEHTLDPLMLRSGNSATLDVRGIFGSGKVVPNPTVVVITDNSTGPQLSKMPTEFCGNCFNSPAFGRELYSKSKRKNKRALATGLEGKGKGSVDLIDPCQPCWVDYLVDDLGEEDAHMLFRLVCHSKVPQDATSVYKTAIEEALVFAFNRKGYALDPLESLRVCTYFIRRVDSLSQKEQLLAFWKHAGRWCLEEMAQKQQQKTDPDAKDNSDSGGSDIGALRELRFKRWNNVSSELIAMHSKTGGDAGLQTAWSIVAEWHSVWTRIMRTLCPEWRREFAEGNNRFAYPFWRPKMPGRYRLHELTLSSKAVNYMLVELCKTGHVSSAAELLGLATSEAGVPIETAMFNILLRGIAESVSDSLADRSHGCQKPHSPALAQPQLAWINRHAPMIYKGATSKDMDSENEYYGSVAAVLRGMVHWGVIPDALTLLALVQYSCRIENRQLLKAVLQLFASKWQIKPSERCWKDISVHGLENDAQRWVGQALFKQRAAADLSADLSSASET
ncbi:hypothetical protein GGI25_004860 [Coemansia spiralis]|uniref:Uncharacterized protein n=2 Tax=Coemansia TaxID=4863 RepID=A0A9W8G4U2_9FUNG|nr:hypothetical protein EDC05_003083 [Coemansia umbellata]KAJ2625300.1 hypothetical protein GGI26_000770 [Coemansia sp. RSA 1358]KAJ2673045.1 hypothetical protein GGI25_004860 [Coemansia spiralis]